MWIWDFFIFTKKENMWRWVKYLLFGILICTNINFRQYHLIPPHRGRSPLSRSYSICKTEHHYGFECPPFLQKRRETQQIGGGSLALIKIVHYDECFQQQQKECVMFWGLLLHYTRCRDLYVQTWLVDLAPLTFSCFLARIGKGQSMFFAYVIILFINIWVHFCILGKNLHLL